MRTRALVSAGGLLAAAFALTGTNAHACGGCFHDPAVDSVVTGHRMAFAVSENRTVLWDQIQYTGDPGDFGWVLPVEPGATIELSTDAFFEALETATSTQISPPNLVCSRNGNSGCFTSSDALAPGGEGPRGAPSGPNVTVIHQGSLGPFEQVTLGATDSGSLREWLSTNGYAIQDDVDPIIDDYIAEGMDFIALRLRGDSPMQPVRVVTPNGHAVLPLRMVMAGTGSSVDVVLYAIGEQRLGLRDLTEVAVDTSSLTYDYTTSSTNYASLRADALAQHLGASFITTFAALNPFGRSSTRVLGTSGNTRSSTQLGQLYFDQAFETASIPESGCSLALTGVTNDALVETADQANQFACGGFTDIAAAMLGMHPSRVWMSRMEMTLPRDVLGMDCRVEADASQKGVSTDVTATRVKNAPCAQPIFESRIARERTSPALSFAWAMAGMSLIALARRRRRSR